MNLPSCPADLWPEFSQLLDAALELPESERAAWLDRLPEKHAAVRPWLKRLLVDEKGLPEDFLARPHLPPLPAEFPSEQVASIGPYRLIGELGRGGMGVVYCAERISGVSGHRVALKVIKRGMDTDEILARFCREREILAQLKHPNITALVDGGATESGQAWFAMEFVEGVPILAWCDAHSLSLAARVELFLPVCAAVQYAHRNLIVHRDLKPSNILIDREGRVKLLDFGIAKLLSDATETQTQSQLKLFTPEYAAPEQRGGGPITTATDVYQLGLVLHELLCGQRPPLTEGGHGLRLTGGLDRGGTAAATAIAAARQTTPKALRRALRGDLGRIVQQALHADAKLRYDSAAALADDLSRYLRGRPVRAAGESWLYRISKFLRRHVVASAIVALLLVGLVTATAAALITARREHVQRERAEAVAGFLETLFRNADPRVSLKPQTPAGELLEAGARSVADRAELGTDVQQRLFLSIAQSTQSLGLYERAHQLYTKARDLARAEHDAVKVASISAKIAYNDWEWGNERYSADELELVQALLQQPNLPPLGRGLLHYAAGVDANNVSRALLSEQHLREAQEDQRSLVDYDAEGYATLLMLRGENLCDLNDYPGADALLREAVLRLTQLHGDGHATTLRAQLDLLDNEMSWHHRASEEAIARIATRMQTMLGPAHHNTLDAKNLLGRFYLAEGRTAEALGVFESLVQPSRALFGEHSYNAAVTYLNVGLGQLRLDRRAAARDSLQQAMAAADGLREEEVPVARARAGLALLNCLDDDGHGGAESALTQLQTMSDRLRDDAGERVYPWLMLNQCRAARGQDGAMLRDLPALIAALRERNGENDSDTRSAVDLLSRVQARRSR